MVDVDELQAQIRKIARLHELLGNERVIVRIDGRDLDVTTLEVKEDGVLGPHVVINTEPLQV